MAGSTVAITIPNTPSIHGACMSDNGNASTGENNTSRASTRSSCSTPSETALPTYREREAIRHVAECSRPDGTGRDAVAVGGRAGQRFGPRPAQGVCRGREDGTHDVPAIGYPEGQGAGASQLRDGHLRAAGALSLVVREAL